MTRNTRPSPRSALAALACALFLTLSGPAAAADTEFSVGFGGSVSTTPYKKYDTQWRPFPLVSLESDHFYIRGYSAGVKLLNLEFLELSLFGGYDDTSFHSSDTSSRRLRKLRERYSSGEAGAEARLLTPCGMLHASAARDVLGNSEGWNGALGYKYSAEFGPLEFIPALGAYWASARYNDYYYGVRGNEARKSGLGAYDAGAGLSPYLGLTVSYSVSERWDVFCSGEVTFLPRELRDSPMVGGSRTQSVTTGIMYNF